jgi:dTMP kinase
LPKTPGSRQSGGVSRGVFITFEGSEGCGKSTQVRRLAERLQTAGRTVLVTREPGGTPVGEEIRHLLQFHPAGHGMKPETELLLFAASRAQLVREVIEPALAAGTVVIADRFLDSTTVYQGVARALDTDAVRFINGFAVGACRPDVTFILDLDPAVARRRLLRRLRPVDSPDRMEQQPEAFYEAVRVGYQQLAADETVRCVLLDGAVAAADIAARINQVLSERFPWLS